MSSSWQIARIHGIPVKVHASFLLLLGWIAFVEYARTGRWVEVLDALLFIIVLFAIITLHELGHALTAARFGIRTRSITLLPIGGVALLERMARRPVQELLIALAGPAVNIVLAAHVFAVAVALHSTDALFSLQRADIEWLPRLFWVNITLAVFNLLPAFPMDGGRILRAGLALRLGELGATRIAVAVGRAMALILGFVGVAESPLLVIVAVFIWIGAGAELEAIRIRSELAGVFMSEVMMTRVVRLSPDTHLVEAMRNTLSSGQQDFPVVENGVVVGLLDRSQLLAAVARDGPLGVVGDAMTRQFRRAQWTDDVNEFVEQSAEPAKVVAPVFKGAELVGLFTPENLAEFLEFRRAASGAGKSLSYYLHVDQPAH